MPPRSISSAVALVGLCSLAAVETGACSNSSKSLASVTRSGLPLLSSVLRGPIAQLSLTKLSRAVAANEPEVRTDAESFVEHGFGTVSGLHPHCGRYEFKNNGNVVAWDALVSAQSPAQLMGTLSTRDRQLSWSNPAKGVWIAERTVLGKAQTLQVYASSASKLPPNCRELTSEVHAVFLVAETL